MDSSKWVLNLDKCYIMHSRHMALYISIVAAEREIILFKLVKPQHSSVKLFFIHK